MNVTISINKRKIIYSDSFKKRKNNPSWKENGEIMEREEIYSIIYKDLLSKLFDFCSSIVIGGPSNEEVQHIKELENKYIIRIFEPDINRVKELKRILENVEIIEDYIFNIKRYFDSNSIDCAILLNIINWIPTDLKSLLSGLYSSLRHKGKIIISFYIDLSPYSKDIKYLVETPLFFREIVEKYSLKSCNYYYHDANGILKVYVIDRKDLKNILKEVEREEYRIRKILSFLTSFNQSF